MTDPIAPDAEALANRMLSSYERERARRIRLAIHLAFFFVAPVVAFTAWLVLFGYHHHVLVLTQNGKGVRLVSHRAQFQVEPAVDDGLSATPPSGSMIERTDRVVGNRVQPRAYGFDDWSFIETSEQVVSLPNTVQSYQFTVNNIPFTLTPKELSSGPKRWLLPPDGVVEINVDQLDELVAKP